LVATAQGLASDQPHRKYQIITGLIGLANNNYCIFELFQFNKIGQADSLKDALKILKE
jgi:hypothetical protein